MNCKQCGSLLTENDQFCKNCGAAVTIENAQTNNIGGQFQQNNVGNPIPQNNMSGQNLSNNMGMQPPQNNMNYNYQQQPAWANSYGSQQNYNQMQPKNNNTKFIIIGIIIVILIGVGILLIGNFGNKGTDNNEQTNNGGSTTTQPTSVSSTYKVNYGGFRFNIPNDLIYEKTSSGLAISDDISWISALEIFSGNYSTLRLRYTGLKSECEKTGYKCSAATIKNYGGVEFITMEMSRDGKNAIVAYTKANATNIFALAIMTNDNDFDYNVIQKSLAPIVKSATYVGEGNNIKIEDKLSIDFVNEILK